MFSPHKRHLSHLLHLLLSVLLLGGRTADGALNGSEAVSSVLLASVPSSRDIVAKEGSSASIECNVTAAYDDIKWYNSKGTLLGDADEKWNMEEKGVLNITAVSFDDRGRYTCVTDGAESYAVTLRVAHIDGGLGLCFVVICLVTFTIIMILNVARLCMVSSHLKKTERAINEFFRTEGAEKLQKALEVAKRIPIVTSAKTLELAKVTQFKTMEFARHMEDLARSVPLPPLILNCRASGEDVSETGGNARPLAEQFGTSASRNRQAIGPPSAERKGDEERGEVCRALLPPPPPSGGNKDVKVSVHTVSEKVVDEDKDAGRSLRVPGSRTSLSYESNV
ncbi:microfibrillar-associated protein 3-like [Cebidichthys violaceus]|uniref:microfibrillar-associated protein 3-like n=1 Tax=Cebidichthys violaceus TaxID=271503 RepID=UPI0035CAF1BD